MLDRAVHNPSSASNASTSEKTHESGDKRICFRCHYGGPMQVYRSYPLLLRWYIIALAFCCGVLPGVVLLIVRRTSRPTLAIVCPRCDFLRLEHESL